MTSGFVFIFLLLKHDFRGFSLYFNTYILLNINKHPGSFLPFSCLIPSIYWSFFLLPSYYLFYHRRPNTCGHAFSIPIHPSAYMGPCVQHTSQEEEKSVLTSTEETESLFNYRVSKGHLWASMHHCPGLLWFQIFSKRKWNMRTGLDPIAGNGRKIDMN